MNTTPLDTAINILGSQKALAELVGLSQQSVSLWRKKGGTVPAEYVKTIESATEGEVNRYMLRPDLWSQEDCPCRKRRNRKKS